MTTIAYRDGIMAADSRAYSGNKLPIGSKVKIRRLDDGTLIGASSTKAGGAEWVLDWYAAGHRAEAGVAELLPEVFDLLVAKPNGEVYVADDTAALSGPLTGKFFAVGSGAEYALGAMATGCSARKAVRLACGLDVWSELPIHFAFHDSIGIIKEE